QQCLVKTPASSGTARPVLTEQCAAHQAASDFRRTAATSHAHHLIASLPIRSRLECTVTSQPIPAASAFLPGFAVPAQLCTHRNLRGQVPASSATAENLCVVYPLNCRSSHTHRGCIARSAGGYRCACQKNNRESVAERVGATLNNGAPVEERQF